MLGLQVKLHQSFTEIQVHVVPPCIIHYKSFEPIGIDNIHLWVHHCLIARWKSRKRQWIEMLLSLFYTPAQNKGDGNEWSEDNWSAPKFKRGLARIYLLWRTRRSLVTEASMNHKKCRILSYCACKIYSTKYRQCLFAYILVVMLRLCIFLVVVLVLLVSGHVCVIGLRARLCNLGNYLLIVTYTAGHLDTCSSGAYS